MRTAEEETISVESRHSRWTTEEPQGVTFVELFFDLVFVYAVTQITSLLHADLTLVGTGRSLLILWLVWWAWTQFTWTLNPADTTDNAVKVITLTAVGAAFFMAQAVPDAFSGGEVVGGIIAIAVALEEVLAHPEEPLELSVLAALATGSVLYVGGVAWVRHHADHRSMGPAVILLAIIVGVLALSYQSRGLVTLAAVAAVLVGYAFLPNLGRPTTN